MELVKGRSLKCTYFQFSPIELSTMPEPDHRSALRRFLLMKYIQFLVLPSSHFLVSVLGMFGSLYIAMVLRSPSISRKCTTVFISNLVKADLFVLLKVALGLLSGVSNFRETLCCNLMTANQHSGCLLISCLSLEVLLISIFPIESRQLRTVRRARQASAIIWVVVLGEFMVLQAAESFQLFKHELGESYNMLVLLFQNLVWAVPFLQTISLSLGILLWIGNVFVYCVVYSRAPVKKQWNFKKQNLSYFNK
ncbi:G-protein coupled receptor 183-A-like [Polypterus senegalus]